MDILQKDPTEYSGIVPLSRQGSDKNEQPALNPNARGDDRVKFALYHPVSSNSASVEGVILVSNSLKTFSSFIGDIKSLSMILFTN